MSKFELSDKIQNCPQCNATTMLPDFYLVDNDNCPDKHKWFGEFDIDPANWQNIVGSKGDNK